MFESVPAGKSNIREISDESYGRYKIEVLRNIIEILDAETAVIGSTQYVLEADEKLYETYNFYKFQLRRVEQNVV